MSVPRLIDRARRAARVAFIVPPSPRRVLRGYYCTAESKGRYYWPQIDHPVQAAYLQQAAEVRMFDGVLQGEQALMAGLRAFAPELAVVSVGGFTAAGDRAFAERASRELALPWVATGEAVLFRRSYWDGAEGLVGLLTNFAGDGLLRFLREGVAGEGFAPLAAGVPVSAERPALLKWGPPPDWSLQGYRFPMLGRPIASVMTVFGCPFACNYCSNNRNVLGLRFRDEDDLVAELAAWAGRGVRNLFFSDLTFGGTAPRAKAILRRMIAEGFDFRWVTFLRPEMVDEELAVLLREAGCVQVQMGVEAANRAVLAQVARHGNARRVEEAFRRLDAHGIRRGAHFVLGLPGETEADVRDTIDLALRLDPDFASFNAAEVRAGTHYYARGAQAGCAAADCGDPLGAIAPEVLRRLKRGAVWRTYLRPAFARRLARTLARDPRLVWDVATDGAAMLAGNAWEAVAPRRAERAEESAPAALAGHIPDC